MENFMKNVLLYSVILIFSTSCCKSGIDKNIKDGDIIFHESMSSQGVELKLATKSKYTHMGIIYKNKDKFYVYEAVQPVRLTPLDKWIKRGKNKHYVIKRLKNADEILTTKNILKMKKIGKYFKEKDYDNLFQWDDNKIYCSELVWKIYKRVFNIEIGKLQKFKDFDLTSPKVKALIKKRYGNKINLDEIVISPIQMFNSDLLVKIKEEN